MILEILIIIIFILIIVIFIYLLVSKNLKLTGGKTNILTLNMSIIIYSPDRYVKNIMPEIFKKDKYKTFKTSYINIKKDKYFDLQHDYDNGIENEQIALIYDIMHEIDPNWNKVSPDYVLRYNNTLYLIEFDEDNNHHTNFNNKEYERKFLLYNELVKHNICKIIRIKYGDIGNFCICDNNSNIEQILKLTFDDYLEDKKLLIQKQKIWKNKLKYDKITNQFNIIDNNIEMNYSANDFLLFTNQNKLNKLCKYIIKHVNNTNIKYALVSIKIESNSKCLYAIDVFITYINNFTSNNSLKLFMNQYDKLKQYKIITHANALKEYVNENNNIKKLRFLYE